MRSNTTVKRGAARFAAVTGIMGAEAIVLGWLESLLPALPFMPPGAKPGLSNVITMFAAGVTGLPSALCVTLIKSVFVLLTRGIPAAFMSASGGLLSAAVMYLLMKYGKGKTGITGISVISAVFHNAGQFAAASILAGSNLFVPYAPALLLYGVLAGILTGIIMKTVLPVLMKQYNKISF